MASAHRHRRENWLFSGGEATGQRSAIIYTLIECARRHAAGAALEPLPVI